MDIFFREISVQLEKLTFLTEACALSGFFNDLPYNQ